jgi:Tfp pilus assembly protein PilO
MAIDMNMDIGELVKNLFAKKGSKGASSILTDNPYAKIIIAGILVLLVIILYVVFVYMPMQEKLEQQQRQISQVNNLKNDIAVLSVRITKEEIKLEAAKKDFNSRTKLFHTDKELEDLYRHISMLALSNQLMVSKLEKVDETPVFEVQKGSTSKKKSAKNKVKKVAYYEFKVRFEINGNYYNYTKFRKGMAELKKIINIDVEEIIVLESKTKKGEVKVSTTLSTYRLPANESEKTINPGG